MKRHDLMRCLKVLVQRNAPIKSWIEDFNVHLIVERYLLKHAFPFKPSSRKFENKANSCSWEKCDPCKRLSYIVRVNLNQIRFASSVEVCALPEVTDFLTRMQHSYTTICVGKVVHPHPCTCVLQVRRFHRLPMRPPRKAFLLVLF